MAPHDFGRFELGAVEVFDGEGAPMVSAPRDGFVTIGDDVEIEVEGPRAPEIAAFIVLACNLHDEMLEVLKRLVFDCKADDLQTKAGYDVWIAAADAVIAKAEAREHNTALAAAEPMGTA